MSFSKLGESSSGGGSCPAGGRRGGTRWGVLGGVARARLTSGGSSVAGGSLCPTSVGGAASLRVGKNGGGDQTGGEAVPCFSRERSREEEENKGVFEIF